MTDLEDAAAWLIIWSVPIGRLVVSLRHGGNLDYHHEDFNSVYEAGTVYLLFAQKVGTVVCE